MRLILLRHGETVWNTEKRLQGHRNSPLTKRGIQQARGIKPMIAELKPNIVVTSDLGRTRQTAEIVGYPKAILDPQLRELNMGIWSARKKTDIIKENPTLYDAWRIGEYTPAGGENFFAFCDRITNALIRWSKKDNNSILAIVHSGVIRAACVSLLELSPKHLLPVTQGTLTILNIEPGAAVKLEAYNLGMFAPDADVID